MMPLSTSRYFSLLMPIIALILVLSACNDPTMAYPIIASPSSALTPTLTPVITSPTPPPTATVESPGRVMLVSSPDDNSFLAASVRDVLTELSSSAGLELELISTIDDSAFGPDLKLVVTLLPDPGLANLVASAPQIQFLAIGLSEIEPTANLSLINLNNTRPDYLGFLAGYIAAVVTPEWRVGVLNLSDTPSGLAARDGFVNGAVFFCGLCRQTYPPFNNYPLFAELPFGSSALDWEQAAQKLVDLNVKTVFITPGVEAESLLSYLVNAKVNIIGTTPPPEVIRDQWVVTIQPNIKLVITEVWQELMTGKGGWNLPVSLELVHVNPTLFSTGRQLFVEELMLDMLAGYIDSGVK